MSPTITLKGALKFTMKKLIIGGEMSHSTYTGPGELLLAPHSLGDVTTLRIGDKAATGHSKWTVARDGYLASTQGVVKEYKSQGIGKGIFSGEGFFVYKMTGVGIVWLTSFGAIIRKDVSCAVHRLCLGSDVCGSTDDPSDDFLCNSYKKEKSTSSTTVTSWPGTATTNSSVRQAAASFQI